jgi:hypothetical protein
MSLLFRTLHMFEIRHYIRLKITWPTVKRMEGILYIRMDKIAPFSSLSESLTHGTPTSSQPSLSGVEQASV